jgi:ABC-2 type transport system permease protein
MLFLSASIVHQRALAARRDWSSRTVYTVAISAAGFLFLLILAGTYLGVRTLVDAQAWRLLWSIPVWAFLVYLFTDIFIAFGQALGDLYLSADMPGLLTMPLRTSSIVVAKFVSGVFQNEIYVGTFLVPFVLGYFLGTQTPWWAYPIALIGVAVFPAMLYAVLAAVTILALRYIPSQQAKETLWLLGAIVPTTFWVASFSGIARAHGDISTLQLPAPPVWLPSTWIGNVVSLLSMGHVGAALLWFGFLLLATVVACPIALAFISRSFTQGWSESITVVRRAATHRARRLLTAKPWVALFRKDAWTLVRTPQLWFSHITSLGFVGYLLVGHKVQTPLLPLTPQLAMAQIGFVAVLAGLNPGMTALSLEHSSIWILRALPFTTTDILRSKFLVAWGQTAIVICFGAAALAYGYGFGLTVTVALVIFALLMSMASVSFGLAFDTTFPSFTWDNPNAINRGIRMIIPFLGGVGTLIVCAAALGAMRITFHGVVAVEAGLAMTAAITGVVAFRALRTSYEKIEALEV